MPLSIPVWDFLDRDFLTISPDANLGEAMESMNQAAKKGKTGRSLIVVGKDNEPLGVISMRNILDAFKSEFSIFSGLLGQDALHEALENGLRKCSKRQVKDYMVKVPTLKMSDDIITAYKLLTEKKLDVRALPVVEADKVEGVVRIPELFDALCDAYRKIA